MPTIIHESFIRRVDAAIQAQLDAFADDDGSVADFAGSIIPTDSLLLRFQEEEGGGGRGEEKEATDAKLRRPLSQHEPDISFKHKDAKWPSVLIEISCSQKRKDLPRLADTYITKIGWEHQSGRWVGYRVSRNSRLCCQYGGHKSWLAKKMGKRS
jgi:hypothetical protein